LDWNIEDPRLHVYKFIKRKLVVKEGAYVKGTKKSLCRGPGE
jgi:hypothetical protein